MESTNSVPQVTDLKGVGKVQPIWHVRGKRALIPKTLITDMVASPANENTKLLDYAPCKTINSRADTNRAPGGEKTGMGVSLSSPYLKECTDKP